MGVADSANLLDGGSNNELVVGDVDYFENLELPEDWLNDVGFVEEWDSNFQIPFDDTFLQSTNNEVPEINQLPNSVHGYTGSDSNKIEEVQETLCVLQPTSPVSELESSGSCSGAKSLPIKLNIGHPIRRRSKLVRSSGVDQWKAVAPDFASAATARRRTSNSRRYKNRCKKMPQLSVARKSMKDSFYDAENPATIKKCTHCQISKTPQWREGPNGPKTLCNACGVRYRSGRLYPEYRPAASPTFVPSLHSNSHKKVIEMRNNLYPEYRPGASPSFVPSLHSNSHKKVEMRNKVKPYLTIDEEPPIMSPQPEFLPVNSYPIFEEVPIPFS